MDCKTYQECYKVSETGWYKYWCKFWKVWLMPDINREPIQANCCKELNN